MLPKLIPLTVIVVCFAFVPVLTDDRFLQDLTVMILIFATFATAWNIAGGLTGLFSLGHGALFAIGAYGSVLLSQRAGVPVLLAILLAACAAVAVALVIGFMSLRLSGHYFALATLAFGAVGLVMLSNFSSVTGGDEGISIPFAPDPWGLVFQEKAPYIYLSLALYVVMVLVLIGVVRSKWGFRMRAVREDETTARSMGVPVLPTKLLAVCLSGFFSSLAGSVFAYYTLYITPANTASVNLSLEPALMAIIGGMLGIYGPLVGAILIVLLEQQVITVIGTSVPGLSNLIYGGLLVLCILVVPNGILGVVDRVRPRRRGAEPAADASVDSHALESA